MPDAAQRYFWCSRPARNAEHFWQQERQPQSQQQAKRRVSWLSTVLPALMLPAFGFAAALDELIETNPLTPGMWLTFTPQIVTASFRWNIAGDAGGGNPNVFSEYKWQRLQTAGLRVDAGRVTPGGWSWRLTGSYGRIVSGTAEQTEYLGNNRTQQSFLSTGRANGGQTSELELAVGQRFHDQDTALTPELGLCTSHQRLLIRNGQEMLPSPGANSGLNSNYRAHWYGLSVGARARWQMVENLAVETDASGMAGVYRGAGNLDQRVDLEHPSSFSQSSRYLGWRLHGQVVMLWSDGVEFAFGGGAEARYLGRGRDRLHYAEGGGYDSRFNGGRWQAYTLDLALRYFW